MGSRTITLQFANNPKDQALYRALRDTAEAEDRYDNQTLVKYLLEVSLGLRSPDLEARVEALEQRAARLGLMARHRNTKSRLLRLA